MSSGISANAITISVEIEGSINKVWNAWVNPNYIIQWNFAHESWCCPWAKNVLLPGQKYTSRMEAKDGSFGFDFWCEYLEILPLEKITAKIGDGRNWETNFKVIDNKVIVTEIFEPENENPADMQRDGWQAILNNFKKFVETNTIPERLIFEIQISKSKFEVYKQMLFDKYKEWTAVFNPTSDFEGNWEINSKMLFIGIDETGAKGGMISKIVEHIPNNYVSINHLGILKAGEEIFDSEEVKKWAGGCENYYYLGDENNTVLRVELDSIAEYKEYFEEHYPKALAKLKEICEA